MPVPTIRGTGIQTGTASSYSVPFPAGTVAGDFAVICVGHGFGANSPSGWTVYQNLTGSNFNGAVFSKILAAADITAGSVTVTFAGSFNGVLSIITFVGGNQITSADASRNSSGSASISLSTAGSVAATSLMVYFGSNRAASTDTVSAGTLQRQANDGSNASGCLYTESGVSGVLTRTFSYSAAGIGNYQAMVQVASGTPLALSCPGSATLSSAYFVILLNRQDVPVGDLPPLLGPTLTVFTTLDGGNIANWPLNPVSPNPTKGNWDASVTYALNDTVASTQYSITTIPGVLLHPVTYRSLTNNNKGNLPENWDGNWTCVTQPPHNDVTNSSYQTVAFGYCLQPITQANLAAASWQSYFGHSLTWTVAAPGCIVNLVDVYVKLNYTAAGGGVFSTISHPLTNTATTGSMGAIVNPGTNAQLQSWHGGGLATSPVLTLNGFDMNAWVSGAAPGGMVGVAYAVVYAATGGTPPYTYAITAGALPPGLTLNASNGLISGAPTAAGSYGFTIQVTDSTSSTATASCAAPIAAAVPGGGPGGSTVIPVTVNPLPLVPLPDPRKCSRGRMVLI